MTNPFIISGYAGDDTFCDRVEETRRLITLIDNGNNVVLTSPRRVGKTELISHLFACKEIRDRYITVNVDIYATQNFGEFVSCLGKGIVDALRPRGKKWVDNFLAFIGSLRSQLTFDINGAPVWSVRLGEMKDPAITLEEIFRYIDNAAKPCVIAIDEFQQITKYRDSFKVEAVLRTYIQRCSNARFIFSGSQQHLMAEMFISAARPFYQSSTIMSLPLIPKDTYADFCESLFARGGKSLRREVVYDVYDRFSGITAYMQRVMNELYAATPSGGECSESMLPTAINTILDQASDSYEILYYQLTESQRAVMLAIAAKDVVAHPTESEFVRENRLVSASSVTSSIRTLLNKDLLVKSAEGVAVYDGFFRLWLRRRFL